MILVFALTFILAACSLLYELAIAQTVSLFAVNNVVWYSLTIGTFIGSMGLGAFLSPRFFRNEAIWERIVQVEFFLSIVGGLSVLAVHFGQMGAVSLFMQGHMIFGNILFFAIAFIAAALVGILSGAELPLLIELAESVTPGTDWSARVIGIDYLGSLAGAVIFPTMLVSRLDMLAVSWLVALVNIVAAAALAFRFRRSGGGSYGGLLAVFTTAFLVLLLAAVPIQQYFLKAYYYFNYPKSELRRDVQHQLTPYQSIDIVQLGAERDSSFPEILAAFSRKFARKPGLPRGFALYLNRDFQFYADVEEIYHETFAHVPIAFTGRVPQTVLIMGGGDGFLLRELLKYPGIERVVEVEIDPGVVELFRSDPKLSALTGGAYNDRRVALVFDDAYHYIRESKEAFDAVYLDFPAPVDFSLSKLYSSEFYSFVRRRLAPGGFVVADAPGLLDDIRLAERQGRGEMQRWQIFSNTLKAAGFNDVRPFFSLLEDDNPEALAILKKDYVLNAEGGRAPDDIALREDLRNILDNLVSGFILVRPVSGGDPARFIDRGIALDVLNEKRYILSIVPHEDIFTDKKDLRAINSILRPRLPDLSGWWKVRTPY